MTKHFFGLCLLLAASFTTAEQKQSFTHFDTHYVVFATTFLSADIASRYDIVRAPDRALVNISLIDRSGAGTRGKIVGTTKNLLSQTTRLHFKEVVEEEAVYYLAEFKHTHLDMLTFTITIEVPGHSKETFTFKQKMYVTR